MARIDLQIVTNTESGWDCVVGVTEDEDYLTAFDIDEEYSDTFIAHDEELIFENNIIYQKDGLEINGDFLSLDEIQTNILKHKVQEENLCILTLEWKSSRGFDGIKEEIVVDYNKALNFKDVIGESNFEIHFGEINGKHSEISGTLNSEEISISKDEDEVINFLKYNPNGRKYNFSFIDQMYDNLSEYNEAYDENPFITSDEFWKLLF